MSYSPIQSSRLYEQIVEQIEKHIVDGTLQPGDKLPSERQLCEQFSVSRTVIREAIRALHQKGFVDIQHGRGTFITNSTADLIRNSLGLMVKVGQEEAQQNLIGVREILEPEIAALAAQNASDDDIAEMQANIDMMDKSLKDAEGFIAADHAFHIALAKASGNSLISILIDPIVDLLYEQRKYIFLNTRGATRGQYHHKRILAAIKERNAQAAREAMRAHMEQIRNDSSKNTNSNSKNKNP